jgi:hypothetical protein
MASASTDAAQAPASARDPGRREPAALRSSASASPGTETGAPLGSRLEITAGTDGMLVMSETSRKVSFFTEGRYRLTRLFQLGGSLAYRYQGANDTSGTAFQALMGPTINPLATTTLGSAFFISPMFGITTGQTRFGRVVVSSNTQLTGSLHAGKRFELGANVSYAPTLGVVKEWDFNPHLVVQPIAVSVFF